MSTDPRIEAAAKALLSFDTSTPLDDVPGPVGRDVHRRANAALAAADKAATITTVEGLDALPVESVVRDAYGIVFENDLLDQSKARKWATLIDNELVASARISIPARVLYLGGS